MPKLFTVTVETEVVVLAESQEEAEDLAKTDFRDLDVSDFSFVGSNMRYLPGDWETYSIPFGLKEDSHPDRTVQEWIDLGAAPFYIVRSA